MTSLAPAPRRTSPLQLLAVLGHVVGLAVVVGWFAARDADDDLIGPLIACVAAVSGTAGLLGCLAIILESRRRGRLTAGRYDLAPSDLPPARVRSGLPAGVPLLLWLAALLVPAVVVGATVGPGVGIGLQLVVVVVFVDLLALLGGVLVAMFLALPVVLLLPAPAWLRDGTPDATGLRRVGLALVLLPIVPLAVAAVLALQDAGDPSRRGLLGLLQALTGSGLLDDDVWVWVARLCVVVLGVGIVVSNVGWRRHQESRRAGSVAP